MDLNLQNLRWRDSMMHKPRKRFGQHFLCDKGVIERIITSLGPCAKEHLIEIGAGQGALTLPLLKELHQLEVIEIDRDLIAEIKERASQYGTLIIHAEDVLNVNFANLKKDARLLRIFGNIPYNISTPLIFHLLDTASMIQDMVLMVQKEVAHRLSASAGSDHYGRLSVMVQYHCNVQLLFDVSPNAFYPPPQVWSSVVKLIPYRELPYLANDYPLFVEMVRHAFGQRRKTLRNSLKNIVSDSVWQQVSISSDLRAESLTVKDFVELANHVAVR